MANYSTVGRVRIEAGLEENTSVLDAVIQEYLDQATGILESYISRKYNVAQIKADPNFTGSSTELLFKRIEELIAACHLLNKLFGIDEQNNKYNGDKKCDDAYKLINDVLEGIIKLTDGNGNPYPSVSTSDGGPVFAYPTDPEGKLFTIDQVF